MMRGAILKILAGSALAVGVAQPANAVVTLTQGTQMSVGGNAQLDIGGVASPTAGSATQIDFLTGGSTGLGTAGTVTNYIGTGTFAGEVCGGSCGTINDILNVAVGGSASPLFSLLDGVTFSLTNITSVDRSDSNVLTFKGTGSFGGSFGGDTIASTPGSFVFSTQGGTLTTFSATAIALPEPGTWAMMLLGFGGIGLAMRRRRRPVLAQVA